MSQSISRQQEPLPEHWIEKLFSEFALIYGTKFTALWQGIDAQEIKRKWADSLGCFTGDQLKGALIALEEKHAFPPTLPEFKMLCKAQRIEPCHQPFIPKLTTKDPEKGKQAFARIREILTAET